MATAKQFLDTLEIEKLVPDSVLDELYEEYRATGGAMTAESLADKLVSKGSLSREKADLMLMSPSDSFVQVGAASLTAKRVAATTTNDPFGDGEEGGEEGSPDAGRRKHVKRTHKNDHDSPLILIGGGVLGLLVLGGAALYFLMNLQSGDQLIDSAKDAYASGSYSQAREEYEAFVEDFSGHVRWSEARVALSVVKLRQLVEGSTDWDGALGIVQKELPLIEDEPAFPDARSEFASLVPRITRGLAKKADEASAADDGSNEEEVDRLVARTEESLTILGNTKYVPKSQRDDGEIAEIRELLARVGRRREALADLNQALSAIEAATTSGETATAYQTHSEFVSRRPALRDDERLAEKLAAAIEAERQTIRFMEDAAEAATDERPTPIALALPLATPRKEGAAGDRGLLTRQFAGVLYGLEATNGELLWRRPIGERLAEVRTTPIDDDLLVIDHRHGELLRLKASSGKLVWRVPVEQPGDGSGLNQPAVAGDRVLVSSESGRLWAIEASTGRRLGYTAFAQPLRTAPGIDPERGVAYVAGQQSSLYSLSVETLECLAVQYTGHATGAMPVAPVFLDGLVLTLENAGESTGRLSVYGTDDSGAVTEQRGEERLAGVVSTPIGISGRRAVVTTESGATYLFDVVVDNPQRPLTLVASRGVESGPAHRRYAVEINGGVWIAGRGLRRTAASPADSQLASRTLADACDGDLFIGPLETRGGTILHSRLEDDGLGAVVAASDARTGEIVWETNLATPLAAAPAVSRKPQGVVATTATGHTHLLDSGAIRAGVSKRPIAEPSRLTSYTDGVPLGRGEAVLINPGASQWLAASLSPRPTSRVARLPGEAACRPTALAKYLVTPLSVGQVHLLSPSGKPVATPFQPSVTVGQSIRWTRPAVTQLQDQRLVVLSDGAETVYCLGLSTTGSPALERVSSKAIVDSQPKTVAAIAGDRAAIGLADAKLAVFDLPGLTSQTDVALPSPIAWGPFAVSNRFLLATEDGTLYAIDATTARIAWQQAMGVNRLVGDPMPTEGGVVVALRGGSLKILSLADGEELSQLSLGQSLGTGPSAYGSRFLVGAADGTVLVINKP